MQQKSITFEERSYERMSSSELLSFIATVVGEGTQNYDVQGDGHLKSLDKVHSELADCGSLAGIMKEGLSDGVRSVIRACFELHERLLMEEMQRGDPLTSPDSVRLYLRSRLKNLEHEVFAMLLLDTKHRVIRYEELFTGTLDGAAVYPREVVKLVLAHNAAAVILVHNHPSFVSEPSQADRAITERLKNALALIDVRVLDHLIIGDEVTSFAERGML